MAYNDDEDDDDYDDEEADYLDDDDEPDVGRCPECGREVYGDATSCPYCHHYFVDHQPWYYAPGGILSSQFNSAPLVIAVIVMLVCIWFLALR